MENLTSAFVSNQNLMHVKFHVNKFQDNLLSKRLQQLNSEEMKLRLKHQRTSNELIMFLNECKKTTGYLSKMKSFQSNSCLLANNDSPKSNASSDLTSRSSLEIDSKNSVNKFRSISFSTNQNSVNKNCTKIPIGQRKKHSLDETKIECFSTQKKINEKIEKSKQKIPFFEQILQTPSNSGSQCSSLNPSNCSSLSKAPSSSRSESSMFSSNSSESLNENEVDTKINYNHKIRPITCQFNSRIDKEKEKRKSCRSNFMDSTSISNLNWFTTTIDFDDSDLNLNRAQGVDLDVKKSKKIDLKFEIKKPANKQPDITSKSLNFVLNSKQSDYNTSSSMKFSEMNTKITNSNKRNLIFYNQKFPIKINMSRGSIKKKQIEIMNEYDRHNSLELINGLRQVQLDLDERVRQFARKNIQEA